MLLTILGPNLPGSLQRLGNVHVHAAGCADLKRGDLRQAMRSPEKCTEEHDSVQSVVESFYGPAAGGFYDEAGIPEAEQATAWKDHGYVSDFHLAPCTSTLPYDAPAS